jgi:hypothetical protein
MGRKRKSKNSWLSVHWPILGIGTAAVALVSGILFWGTRATLSKPAIQAGAVPVFFNRAEDAETFPATLEPANFTQADVREAYRTAKEIPGVLVQQPCYCYCQRKGHRSLLDCFKTDHAVSCKICIKESLLAGRMHRQGKTQQEIRAAIIQGQWATVETSTE